MKASPACRRRARTTPACARSCRCGHWPSAARIPPSRRSTWTWSESSHQGFVDLLAGGAHRELLRVAARRPLLAAQRAHGLPGKGRLEDLLLLHVVGEALVVARLDGLLAQELFQLAVEGR